MPQNLLEKFELFWETIYPHRNNKKIGKVEARLKWMKYIKSADVPLIFQAGMEFAKSRDVKANIGIKDCHRWIRDGKGVEHWREWIPVKTVDKPEPVRLPRIHIPKERMDEIIKQGRKAGAEGKARAMEREGKRLEKAYRGKK